MDFFFQNLPLVIISAFITYIFTFQVINLSIRHKWYPAIRSRDVHKNPIPRLGGVAIFCAFWLVIIILSIFFGKSLEFSSENIWFFDKKIFGIFLGSILIFATGIWDDKKDIDWRIKLLAQIISAILVVIFGVNIDFLSNPFGGQIDLGIWGIGLIVIWMVVLMNALNWLDGLDGLASGISAIASLILGFLALSLESNQTNTALIAFIFFGVVIGFLPKNFYPARIFLGDSGSMFLGFMIAVLAVISGGKIATAALILGLPILDLIWVVLRRIFSHHSPFLADKLHLHHRLLNVGLSIKQAVLFLYMVSALFGIIALNIQETLTKFKFALVVVALIVALGLLLVYGQKNSERRKI